MKTIAHYSDSYFSGVEIWHISNGIDTIIFCTTYPDRQNHKVKVNTTTGGRDYIRLNNRRYYLDEFLRA